MLYGNLGSHNLIRKEIGILLEWRDERALTHRRKSASNSSNRDLAVQFSTSKVSRACCPWACRTIDSRECRRATAKCGTSSCSRCAPRTHRFWKSKIYCTILKANRLRIAVGGEQVKRKLIGGCWIKDERKMEKQFHTWMSAQSACMEWVNSPKGLARLCVQEGLDSVAMIREICDSQKSPLS